MPGFQRRWSGDDDVVVTRRRTKPQPTPVKEVKSEIILPKKQVPPKPAQEIKVKIKPSVLPEQKKPVEQPKPAQAKKKRFKPFDPEIYSAVTRQIKALLPEPPFEIGIGKEIFERLADSCGVSKTLLRRILSSYMCRITRGNYYLEAVSKASHRNGLDGGKTEMTEKHRKGAEIHLNRRRAKQGRLAAGAGNSDCRK
jgi:hypothetical protein